MRTIANMVSIGACVVAVLATTGCGATSPPGENPTTAPPAQTEPQPSATTPAANPPPTAEQPAQQWVMPNLVGTVLQDAQDRIQTVTGNPVFITKSHDVSGQDRLQALDANWKVCSQNVGPGAALTPDTLVDFGVVKLDETCP